MKKPIEMKEHNADKKFKAGEGFYAYGIFGLATFVPPALALNGAWLGILAYGLSYVAYRLLGAERFRSLRAFLWLVSSFLIYAAALFNKAFGNGFRSLIEAVFVVFVIALIFSTLRVLRRAYIAGEFDP